MDLNEIRDDRTRNNSQILYISNESDADSYLKNGKSSQLLPIEPFTVDSDKIDKEISTSCEKIKQRGIYAENFRTEIEKNFPLIFIRVVYRAYHIQELLFNLMYAPQNLYCYALDRKSNILFREHMKNLSKCFPNVFLTKIEYEVDSAGHNMTRSYLECLNILWKKPTWKYAILLQNDDIPLKSNHEMVQILNAFNGSNVINAGRPFLHRLPKNANWSYAALRLYKNSTKNRPDIQLRIAKGSSSVILSRNFVEFVMESLNLTTLIEMFDSRPYGTDEMLFHSLHSDDSLNAPGGFTRKCIDKQSGFITRSRKYRHNVCIFGVADLNYLRKVRELFANKMLSESDYGAIACWARYLAQRSLNNSTIDLENYKQSQIVRFNNNKAMWRKNISLFKC
ncbi:Beta-1,3-galactosyl-O-glycosyl-glycoprotein beta-1,6-N-acetylglucosaminyltransferase [Dirofilaria immitis]